MTNESLPPADTAVLQQPLFRILGGALGLTLVVWRCLSLPASDLWRDWAAVVGLFLLWRSVRPLPPERDPLVPAAVAYLMGVYIAGQVPHVWTMLGLGG